jgi:hypothetical protein
MCHWITKRALGELDESNEGSNSNEADKPGAFVVIRDKSDRNDDKQDEEVTKDDNPTLVVAAEISPDTADLEAQFDAN